METIKSDILVIGSGAAGLFFALKAAEYSNVRVVTKKQAAQSNTNYAQGGIASVIDGTDSFESHIEDTIEGGRGLCDREAVEIMVREGPSRIEELMELGVRFSHNGSDGNLSLGREGGHSHSRIIHYGDITGRELEENLIRACIENENVVIEESCLAIDLIQDGDGRINGVFLLDTENGMIKACQATETVLATGGAGKIYLYTSNPDIATGDGIAMAYRAGAEISNLEFVQFHPTCLYHPQAKSRLISEALRGEGALLKDQSGRLFMSDYDTRGELAPRDIVARAIDSEMKKSGDKYVLLDISHRRASWLKERFPYIYESCLEFRIDISTDPIPVVPAAHYMVGGVKATIDGRTNLEGLSVIGEVACSGIHGANRLASNSLLESIVMAGKCAKRLESSRTVRNQEPIDDYLDYDGAGNLDSVILDHDWDLARRVMWDYVGIVRSDERLRLAEERIGQISKTMDNLYLEYGLSTDMVELRNIALVSSLVIRCAISRRESRGLHYNVDHPEKDLNYSFDTIIKRSKNE